MALFDNIPWDKIAVQLREEVQARSGATGALLGAGMGAAAAVAGLKASGQKMTPTVILTAAAVGIAYGGVDKRRLCRD